MMCSWYELWVEPDYIYVEMCYRYELQERSESICCWMLYMLKGVKLLWFIKNVQVIWLLKQVECYKHNERSFGLYDSICCMQEMNRTPRCDTVSVACARHG